MLVSGTVRGHMYSPYGHYHPYVLPLIPNIVTIITSDNFIKEKKLENSSFFSYEII